MAQNLTDLGRVAIVGLGSAARRHIANLRNLGFGGEIAVWRRARGHEEEMVEGLVDRFIYDAEEAQSWAPEAAIVANAAVGHVSAAHLMAGAGAHLLVEKPLSNALGGIDDLRRLCEERKLVLAVGYNLRFHPALGAAKKLLEGGNIGRLASVRAETGSDLRAWRAGFDYTLGVTASRKLGGGVLLELSHELDYIRWMCGDVRSLQASAVRAGNLDIEVEDSADLLMRLEGGQVVNLHLDMIDSAQVRRCRLTGTEGTAVIDLIDSVVALTAPDGGTATPWKGTTSDLEATYKAELEDFFRCIATGEPPMTPAADAMRVLQICLAAGEAARAGRVVEV